MEPLFVAEWKYDKKTIYELIPLFRKNSVLSSTATFAVPLFIVLFFCFPHEMVSLTVLEYFCYP